jgi:hypothetical protein
MDPQRHSLVLVIDPQRHSFISVSAGVSVGAGAGTLSRDHARVGWG